jgi:hypothetical protein
LGTLPTVKAALLFVMLCYAWISPGKSYVTYTRVHPAGILT